MLGGYLGAKDCYRTINRNLVGRLRREQYISVCSEESDRSNPRLSMAAYGPSHVATSNSIQWPYWTIGRTGALSFARLPPPHSGEDKTHLLHERILSFIDRSPVQMALPSFKYRRRSRRWPAERSGPSVRNQPDHLVHRQEYRKNRWFGWYGRVARSVKSPDTGRVARSNQLTLAVSGRHKPRRIVSCRGAAPPRTKGATQVGTPGNDN